MPTSSTGADYNDLINKPGTSGATPFNYLEFDTTPTGVPGTQGTLSWDVDHSTLQLVLNGHVGQLMQDTFYYAKNQTGATIPAGTVVRADGTLGSSGRIKITPFLANGTYPSKFCMGVTAEDIANGADGMVMHFGQLRGIDTSAFPDGTVLYASSTSAGAFTSTMPTYPNNQVTVAIVIHSAVNGILQIRPTFDMPLPVINKSTVTDGIAITGTTSGQVTGSILIPANTVAVGDLLYIKTRVRKTGTAGTFVVRMYVNTSTAIGGSLIATSGTNATSALYFQYSRTLAVKTSTNTESMAGNFNVQADDNTTSTAAVSASNINWTIDQYIVVVITNSSTADTTRSSLIHAQINKSV